MAKFARSFLVHQKSFERNAVFLVRKYSVKTQLEDYAKGHISPLDVFQRKVDEGKLKADGKQISIVQKLQRVYEDVSDYTPMEQQNLFSKLFSTHSSEDSPKGLYIHGAVGGGKTMLMDMFYSCCDTDNKNRVHFHSFMIDVHKRIHKIKQINAEVDPILSVADSISNDQWLICFDEFQVTDIADAMILRHLFTRLFENGIVVVATSNRSPEELYKNGLQRSNFLPFIDVLKKHCEVANLDSGIDYRSLTASITSGQYYIVKDPEKLKKTFKLLCSKETDILRPKTLRIQGRNVDFSVTCGRVLYASFNELCDRPLGANDYLTLSQAFHTVIVTDVPQLNSKMESQARRFITLIDTLYDQRVRLIISSEYEVDELFVKPKTENSFEELSDDQRMLMDDLKISGTCEGSQANVFTGDEELFAFARTVSRLNEMRTEDYWNSCNS